MTLLKVCREVTEGALHRAMSLGVRDGCLCTSACVER